MIDLKQSLAFPVNGKTAPIAGRGTLFDAAKGSGFTEQVGSNLETKLPGTLEGMETVQSSYVPLQFNGSAAHGHRRYLADSEQSAELEGMTDEDVIQRELLPDGEWEVEIASRYVSPEPIAEREEPVLLGAETEHQSMVELPEESGVAIPLSMPSVAPADKLVNVPLQADVKSRPVPIVAEINPDTPSVYEQKSVVADAKLNLVNSTIDLYKTVLREYTGLPAPVMPVTARRVGMDIPPPPKTEAEAGTTENMTVRTATTVRPEVQQQAAPARSDSAGSLVLQPAPIPNNNVQFSNSIIRSEPRLVSPQISPSQQQVPVISSSSDRAVAGKPNLEVSSQGFAVPSQTLIEAIRQNSNWSEASATSPVRTSETVKADGSIVRSLRIQLNPVELGKLDLNLRVRSGQLQIEVRIETEQTYRAVSADREAIIDVIKNLGYKVDSLVVAGPSTDGRPSLQNGLRSGEQTFQGEKNEHSARGNNDQMMEFEYDAEAEPSLLRNTYSDDNII